LSYLAVAVLVLVVLAVPLSIRSTQREHELFVADARVDALVLASSYAEAVEQGLPLAGAVAEEYAAGANAEVVIVDRNGTVLLDTNGPIGREVTSAPEIEQALSGIRSTARHSDTRNFQYVAVPIASGGMIHGALRLALDHEPVDDRTRTFRLELVAIATGVLGVAALVGWAIARSVSNPVRRLTGAAARFADGELRTDIDPVNGPPEVRALADAMSTMSTQLDELLTSQRRFVADASHQLRTPLTALRLRLGNSLDAPPEERRLELEAAIEETDRLTALVNSLLELARADDHHGSPPPDATADLARAVRERVDTWSAVADAADVHLEAQVPPGPVEVHADPSAVEQIIDNLLDNALQAAPPHSIVSARVDCRPGAPKLTISDQGPGLTDEEKQLAVQRFWRGDAAGPGTGLGLPIVHSLARASNASLRLEDAPGGGLAVRVAFAPDG
jgi:signal transduction histidine kinase